MAFALASVGSGVSSGLQFLLAPLHAVVSFFAPWQSEMAPPVAAPVASSIGRPVAHVPNVRVVRVNDEGAPHTHAGRMVISGRMADVCAELDRLTRQESAQA